MICLINVFRSLKSLKWPIAICLRPSSSVVRKHLILKNYWANLNQIWYVVSVGKDTRNCKFHAPLSKGEVILGLKSVKLLCFFKNLLNSQALVICSTCM